MKEETRGILSNPVFHAICLLWLFGSLLIIFTINWSIDSVWLPNITWMTIWLLPLITYVTVSEQTRSSGWFKVLAFIFTVVMVMLGGIAITLIIACAISALFAKMSGS